MAYIFDSNGGDAAFQPELDLRSRRTDLQDFKDRLHGEILRSQRRKYPFTIIHLTIEPPPAVDRLTLRDFADLLKSNIREYDLMCPIQTSDLVEFLLAFPEANESHAEQIAGRIRKSVDYKKARADIGIACFPHDGNNAEDLLFSARQDLSLSKKSRAQGSDRSG